MKYLFLITFLFTTALRAEVYSMRDCMLLPITDNAGSSLGFNVFEEVEKYLKTAGWCDYKSSSEVISIFSKYRDQLDSYLDDPSVIKTVADRLRVGSLIRIKLKYEVDKIDVNLEVYGEDGKEVYFSEKAVLNKVDVYSIKSRVESWLEIYEASIPYDGKVLGVLGDQITFDFNKTKRVGVGQEFKIVRLKGRKKHPLLKKIVEWDAQPVGHGKIFNVSRTQAIGNIKVYTSENQVVVGDWVRLEKYHPKIPPSTFNDDKYSEQKFGKLGELALSFSLNSHTATTSTAGGSKKMGGYILGINAETEIYITRNYFAQAEFSKRVGSLDKESGSPSSSSTNQDMTTLKLVGGYKYLPMGFFYGPQINFYGGFVSYSYKLDESASDGHGQNSFSGLLFGVGGSVPIEKGIRAFASGEVIPFGDFSDDDNIFGSTKSTSSMVFEVGGTYLWAPGLTIIGSFEVTNNSGKFKGNNSEVGYSNSAFKIGGLFSF